MGVLGDRGRDVGYSQVWDAYWLSLGWTVSAFVFLQHFSEWFSSATLYSQLCSNHSCVELYCHAEQCGQMPASALPTTAGKGTLENANSQKPQVGKCWLQRLLYPLYPLWSDILSHIFPKNIVLHNPCFLYGKEHRCSKIFRDFIFCNLTFRNNGKYLWKVCDMNLFKWEKAIALHWLCFMTGTVSAVWE